MRTGIQLIGYAMGKNNEWIKLNKKVLIFPKETVGDNPFDFIQKLFKASGINRYLVSFYDFPIEGE